MWRMMERPSKGYGCVVLLISGTKKCITVVFGTKTQFKKNTDTKLVFIGEKSWRNFWGEKCILESEQSVGVNEVIWNEHSLTFS